MIEAMTTKDTSTEPTTPTPEEIAKDKALEILGGVGPVTRLLNIKHYQSVQQWKTVPLRYIPTVERLTREKSPDDYVRCEEMMPGVEWHYLRATAEQEAA